MDGGGGDGYRLMNFAAGGRVQDEPTIINRLMLRFRPIAPKPAAGEDKAGSSSRLFPKVRTKRKYVRVRAAATRKKKNDNNNNNSDKSLGERSAAAGAGADLCCGKLPAATLQLLPDAVQLDLGRSDVKILERSTSTSCPIKDNIIISERNSSSTEDSQGGVAVEPDLAPTTTAAAAEEVVVVETWVTAEGLTAGACMDMAEGRQEGLLGIRMKDLDRDTCPAFVSDGNGIVRWVNDAYRELVSAADEKGRGSGSGSGSDSKVMVRLVVEEKLRPYFQSCPAAFSCWVGLRFRASNSSNGKWCIMRVPCDVWKMEGGEGYAWRLDLKVALKLGL